MFYVKWAILILFWGTVAAVLHYTLPHHDIVRIVNTEVRRVDFGDNSIFWAQHDSGQEGSTTTGRDVRFIEAFRANGKPIVYRNEDTGWGWPPYFKLDSSNLQAEARDLISTKEDPTWVVMRAYGWRSEFMSIFPNAVSVRPVSGPDYRVINWFNIVFLTLFVAIIWAIWSRWRRFRRNRLDPVFDEWGDSLEEAGDRMAASGGRFRRWLDGWRR